MIPPSSAWSRPQLGEGLVRPIPLIYRVTGGRKCSLTARQSLGDGVPPEGRFSWCCLPTTVQLMAPLNQVYWGCSSKYSSRSKVSWLLIPPLLGQLKPYPTGCRYPDFSLLTPPGVLENKWSGSPPFQVIQGKPSLVVWKQECLVTKASCQSIFLTGRFVSCLISCRPTLIVN